MYVVFVALPGQRARKREEIYIQIYRYREILWGQGDKMQRPRGKGREGTRRWRGTWTAVDRVKKNRFRMVRPMFRFRNGSHPC